jgi:hypothetical protein
LDKFLIHGREETLRGINGAAVIPSSSLRLLKLTELSYACRHVHGQKVCIIVVSTIEAPYHLLLIPWKELVMVVVMMVSGTTTTNQINPQVLLMVVIGGCGSSGGSRN